MCVGGVRPRSVWCSCTSAWQHMCMVESFTALFRPYTSESICLGALMRAISRDGRAEMDSSQKEKLHLRQDEVPTPAHDRCGRVGLPDLDPIAEGTASSAARLAHRFLHHKSVAAVGAFCPLYRWQMSLNGLLGAALSGYGARNRPGCRCLQAWTGAWSAPAT